MEYFGHKDVMRKILIFKMPNRIINAIDIFDTFTNFFKSESAPQVDIPICLYDRHGCSEPYIYFNTEQLSRTKELKGVLETIRKTNPVQVWDYSKANIEILKEHGIVATFIPIITNEIQLNRLRSWQTEALYDVGFCGSPSPRRQAIIDQLKAAGLRVHYLQNIHGDARDQELAKCRVLINIHYGDDFKIFELARCEPWLQLGVPVISEQSYDDDDRCTNVPYEKLVETTIHCLNTLKS
jgi:hypothetical protein